MFFSSSLNVDHYGLDMYIYYDDDDNDSQDDGQLVMVIIVLIVSIGLEE